MRRYMDKQNIKHMDMFHPWLVRMMQHAESLVLQSQRKAYGQTTKVSSPNHQQDCIPLYRNQQLMLFDVSQNIIWCQQSSICVWQGCIADGAIMLQNVYNETQYTIQADGQLRIFRPKSFHKDCMPSWQRHDLDCHHCDYQKCEFFYDHDLAIVLPELVPDNFFIRK